MVVLIKSSLTIKIYVDFLLTRLIESRAAMAKMSAQDTTMGPQIKFKRDFILAITLNPLSEFMLGEADCSPVKSGVSTNKTDPSQPCIYSQRSKTIECICNQLLIQYS